LGRHWLGIEQDEDYARLAQQRIDSVPATPEGIKVETHDRRRLSRRIPFGALLERGYLQPGQRLYFDWRLDLAAVILADGHLRCGELQGSIHQVGRALLEAPCNGWDYWYYQDDASGELLTIDRLRQKILAEG
jgi:modification methylase